MRGILLGGSLLLRCTRLLLSFLASFSSIPIMLSSWSGVVVVVVVVVFMFVFVFVIGGFPRSSFRSVLLEYRKSRSLLS